MAKFKNIKAVILDKDGVFVNFHKLWLRVIAMRAQLIAETSTQTSDQLAIIRNTCIRAMGVNPETEEIDPYSPISMPAEMVRIAVIASLYVEVYKFNPKFCWLEAKNIVDKAFADTLAGLDLIELAEAVPGSLEKIQELASADLKLAVLTSDTQAHAQATLSKFGISDKFSIVIGDREKNHAAAFLEACAALGVKTDETLMISDSPVDLQGAKEAGLQTIGLLSGIVPKADKDLLENDADEILNSLKDLNLSSIETKKKALA